LNEILLGKPSIRQTAIDETARRCKKDDVFACFAIVRTIAKNAPRFCGNQASVACVAKHNHNMLEMSFDDMKPLRGGS